MEYQGINIFLGEKKNVSFNLSPKSDAFGCLGMKRRKWEKDKLLRISNLSHSHNRYWF